MTIPINKLEVQIVKRVLVVDDSKTQQLFLGRILEGNGYQKLTAMDGETGIALARSERPDLILMDVVMPRMNGFQATRRISQDPLTADIPIIILSGKDMACDRVWGLRQGARYYLTKPVEKTELMACVESVLNYASWFSPMLNSQLPRKERSSLGV